MIVLHVAQIEITPESGMGRVAWHWREALTRRGHRFVHIGRRPLDRDVHPAAYPLSALAAARRIAPDADVVLAHEPAAAAFLTSRRPTIAFSHGIERRGWAAARAFMAVSGERIALRSRITYPLWRLRPCDRAMRGAEGALVINREDYDYCIQRYGRTPERTFQFRNGVDPVARAPRTQGTPATLLFLGSWLARKGTRTLVDAAIALHAQGVRPRWLLAGTGVSAPEVLGAFPEALRPSIEVIERFHARDEVALHARATLLVLPSFFEGQPLALLQAMAAALPVVTSDCCGQRDLVAHGENGLLFPRGDAVALAACIERCLADPALRARLGDAARASVAGREWPHCADEAAEFIERIHAAFPRVRG